MERPNKREVRNIPTEFFIRETESGDLSIEGHFAVFNSVYEIAPGMSESIAPGAFSNTLDNDIRALINHDTTLVLGRTKAGTLVLKQDDTGLWGHVDINPNDVDAMNLYNRVKRGDVDQCSFGFNIISEETDFRDDGSVHWTMTDLDVHEVSVCTFPAYQETNVSARSEQKAEIIKRQNEAWKEKMKARLKNGTKTTNVEKED